MPHFKLDRKQADSIASFLFSNSVAPKPNVKRASKSDASAGRETIIAKGCLGCHELDGVGRQSVFSGPLFNDLEKKRSREFVYRLLGDPSSVGKPRMPLVKLNDDERRNIAAALVPNEDFDVDGADTDKSTAAGEQLFRTHRCGACHEVASKSQVPRLASLDGRSDWQKSCAIPQENEVSGSAQPSYRLDQADQSALKTYFSLRFRAGALTLRDHLREQNCIGCHQRESMTQSVELASLLAKTHPAVVTEPGTVKPPSLNGVGDKLTTDALERVIRGELQVRPWLSVRMPAFNGASSLANEFATADRIPSGYDDQESRSISPPDHVAARLVTSEGFGCVSCHPIGKVKPTKAPLNTLGPSLSMAGDRIREPWFHRWVRDPARIVPRMEMPSIKQSIGGVLDDDLDLQLHAVWAAINRPGFQPPEPNPVRVIRRSGVLDRPQPAAVLTDVVRTKGNVLVKPFVVGLANRHNLLFDLASGRLSSWWLGDVARQRTDKKTWYWELGGANRLRDAEGPELSLVSTNGVSWPIATGQFVTEPDAWEHSSTGVTLRYRYQFDGEADVLLVSDRFEFVGRSGWRRSMNLSNVPKGFRVRVKLPKLLQEDVDSISVDKGQL